MKKLLKAVYNLIPFKKEIYSALKTVWTPGESIFKHLHFKGIFNVKVNESKSFKIHHFGYQIENEIFWGGLTNSWEKESMKLWIKLCETSQIILDIGANTGIYALVAKTLNPSAKVFAFEPHPMFYKMLEKNITLNNFDITASNNAISSSNGTIKIDDYSGNEATITIQSVTLDAFIKKHALTKVDLIKIDVERHEPQVMEGFTTYLSQFRPTLMIEILTAEIADIVQDYVKDLDYLYFNIDEKGGIRQTGKIEKSDYYNYLLCNEVVAKKIGLK